MHLNGYFFMRNKIITTTLKWVVDQNILMKICVSQNSVSLQILDVFPQRRLQRKRRLPHVKVNVGQQFTSLFEHQKIARDFLLGKILHHMEVVCHYYSIRLLQNSMIG